MLAHLKLATFTWALAILMLLTSVAIVGSAFFVEKNIVVIKDTWEIYQTDFSEKARLEGALRAAIGYGGMIHDFKNYLLRGDEVYKEQAEAHLGAADAILKQYRALDLTTAENIAIEDIQSVLKKYHESIHKAWGLIAVGQSIIEIDRLVRVNDQPSFQALKLLRYLVVSKKTEAGNLSKSRIVADMRAALGYGGMIHLFKNFILRHKELGNNDNEITILSNSISESIQSANNSISQYRKFTVDEAEKIALNDIELTLSEYAGQLKKVPLLIKQNKSVAEIDGAVRVDDAAALRGLDILEREISHHLASRSKDVTNALAMVNQTISLGKWGSIASVIFVMLIAVVLMRYAVILPIFNLTNNMMRLANNKLDTEIRVHQGSNEIGQMARAVTVFKANMIKQQESERSLAEAYKELEHQLEENNRLREQSEQQTSKALLMSEHMMSANAASEKAMIAAEKGELFVSSILNAVRDGIVTINDKGIIEAFNPGAEDIFGYKAYEIIGKNISMLMPEPLKSKHDGYIQIFLDGGSTRDQSQPLEQLALRKNGETFPAEITLNTVQVGGETKITGVVRNVTERKKWEEQIKQLAMTDALTGLANRNEYEQSLDKAAKYAKRFKTRFSLLMLDLDKFKPVNDTYGHPVGDILLKEVADILLETCREVDTVARVGGDEFAIILFGIHEIKDAGVLAEKLVNKLSLPFVIENHHIHISASIGVSCYPHDSDDIDTLKRMADEALYRAKQDGRNKFEYYSEM